MATPATIVLRLVALVCTVFAVASGSPVPTSAQSDQALHPSDLRAVIPPLHLSDEQRTLIGAAVKRENSDVSFALKSAKSAATFEPAIGARLPKGVTPHPLPQTLIQKLPALKDYKYVNFKQQVLIVNPMTNVIVDMFSQMPG